MWRRPVVSALTLFAVAAFASGCSHEVCNTYQTGRLEPHLLSARGTHIAATYEVLEDQFHSLGVHALFADPDGDVVDFPVTTTGSQLVSGDRSAVMTTDGTNGAVLSIALLDETGIRTVDVPYLGPPSTILFDGDQYVLLTSKEDGIHLLTFSEDGVVTGTEVVLPVSSFESGILTAATNEAGTIFAVVSSQSSLRAYLIDETAPALHEFPDDALGEPFYVDGKARTVVWYDDKFRMIDPFSPGSTTDFRFSSITTDGAVEHWVVDGATNSLETRLLATSDALYVSCDSADGMLRLCVADASLHEFVKTSITAGNAAALDESLVVFQQEERPFYEIGYEHFVRELTPDDDVLWERSIGVDPPVVDRQCYTPD